MRRQPAAVERIISRRFEADQIGAPKIEPALNDVLQAALSSFPTESAPAEIEESAEQQVNR